MVAEGQHPLNFLVKIRIDTVVGRELEGEGVRHEFLPAAEGEEQGTVFSVNVITSYSIHYTKLYEVIALVSRLGNRLPH